MSQKTRLTVAKMTASVSLSDDESHERSYSDEESLSDDESHEWSYSDAESGQPSAAAFGPALPRAHTSAAALGPAPPRTSADGQHFAAGKLSKKNMCDVNGSVGKQMRSNAKLASLRAAAAEERRNKNDTGKNATRQPSRGSGGGTQPISESESGEADRTGWQADRERAITERIEEAIQKAAEKDEENDAASDKTRPARKAQLTPARPKPSRDPHRPPSRGRRSAASSSAAASSSGPPSRGGQPSAAASPTNRDQPSAAACPRRRLWGRGCKGRGSSQKWGRKRAPQKKDERQQDFADCEHNEHAREDSEFLDTGGKRRGCSFARIRKRTRRRDTDGRDSQDYDIEVAFHPREDGGIDAVRVSDHAGRRKRRR